MRLLLGILLLVLGISTSLQAQITVISVKTSGNGCPPGTASYQLGNAQQTLQILFSDFIAELPGESVKSCNVQIELQVPPNVALSWYRTEHRGFLDTTGGAEASFQGRYILQGAGLDFVKDKSWPPQTLDYYLVESASPGDRWTKCGGTPKLTMRTMIRLKGQATGYNTVTVDDKTFRAESRLFFATRRC